MSEDAPKFPRSVAEEVFTDLARRFDPQPAWGLPHALCERLCAVGGFRRRKAQMKDLEILYIPRRRAVSDAGDLFGATHEVDVTERLIDELLAAGVLAKRLNKDGHVSSWGPWNKHALHVPTGLPVDLFASPAESYPNKLVVTTGPLESNIRIAMAAKALQPPFEWEVNSPGFVPLGGTWEGCPRQRRTMRSEREVFEFVGLEFLPPEERR